jgi:hypothetical protein
MSQSEDRAAREAAVMKHLRAEIRDFFDRGSHGDKTLLLSILVHRADYDCSLLASIVATVTAPSEPGPPDAFEGGPDA